MIVLHLSNAIGFFIIYLSLNMYASTKKNMNTMCKEKINIPIICIGIALNILIPMLIKPNFLDDKNED
jgi:hypothetical protein